MAFLAPESFDLGHGHSLYTGRGQSVSDRVELEWFDDGHDYFHGFDPRLGSAYVAGSGVSKEPSPREVSAPASNARPYGIKARAKSRARLKCLQMKYFLTGPEAAAREHSAFAQKLIGIA
jgi:hypothetical protein